MAENRGPAKDCFAYDDKTGYCKILMDLTEMRNTRGPLTCTEPCSFFKTGEQFRQDREESYKKVKSMDLVRRAYIADKYCGGKLERMKG